MHLAGGRPVAFPGAMALADDGRAVCMHGEPDPGCIDGEEGATVLAGKDAFGFNRLPIPAVKAEDPIGLRDGVPALDIGEFPAMGLSGTDMGTVRLPPQRLQLFCRKAHQRVLTLKTGSGLERVAPATSAPPLRSLAKTWRLRRGSPGSQ